ncbi:unnamed protein product [Candida verbasci]|uniref:RhoGAP-domain-containing protein n=1 Tax=Candida verbasci TaxID=1227364 RepID=A0A9W4XB83_9ASCO|nr:unnamed protein product [Candida verbasci]
MNTHNDFYLPPPQPAHHNQHHSNGHSNNATTPTKVKKKKICHQCKLDITGQFVRALNQCYHVQCFICNDCGIQCSSKFFPFDLEPNKQVALCEFHFFYRMKLICAECNNALRGPFISALGKKYHLEHFKCSKCHKVFNSNESYYEHNNFIYCHYDYIKLHASHCEGCHFSIVKQFVELYKGGRNQNWHPECYMVHKFWNVNITPDAIGLQKLYNLSNEELMNPIELNIDSNLLLQIEQHIEDIVMKCWMTLSGFEEITATCISDMLLNASTGNKYQGLLVTSKLILYLETLFSALDYVILLCNNSIELLQSRLSIENDQESLEQYEYFQYLKKEPRNITGKIMSYLAILRKSDQIARSGSLSAELLSLVTGCAHYLKLLIRYGLFNALQLNKLYGTTNAIEKFLQLVSEYDFKDDDLKQINFKLKIPSSSTDSCSSCAKSIEKSCVKLDNNRWHLKCFICSICKSQIDSKFASEAKFDIIRQNIICSNCKTDNQIVQGFKIVSDLSQLVYLLKIALSRSCSVMKIDLTKEYRSNEVDSDDYSQTLDDVTRLRSKRQSQKLSKSIKKKARKSIIVETPDADKAKQDEIENVITEELNEFSFNGKKPRQLSFDNGEEQDQFKRKSLKIRDEPQRQITNTHLDRTSDLLKNEKSLTLDDIPRIVAAEQARDQRPNAFKHHNSLYQRNNSQRLKNGDNNNKTSPMVTPSGALDRILNHQPSTKSIKKKQQKYYSELTKDEHFIMRHIAVEALSHVNPSFNKDDLLNLIQTKKQPTFWDKFKFGATTKDKPLGVFGVDLNTLTKKYGIDSDLGVGPSKLRIPIVIDDIISALKQKDMSVEGIFRLNGNIKKLRELTELINKNPFKSPDFSVQNAVQLAALMKKWLRELPNPLLTFNLYDLWISSQREQNLVLRKRVLQLIYCMLPRSRRNLVEVLLYFFSWVASFSEIDEETGSKMDIHNLATVIAPNILISKQSSEVNQQNQDKNQGQTTIQPGSGDNYFLAIEVVNQLIELHEELSIIPPDLIEFYELCGFSNNSEITTKEIMNNIDKFLKEQPQFFDNFEIKNPEGIVNHEVSRATVSKSEYKSFGNELNGDNTEIV